MASPPGQGPGRNGVNHHNEGHPRPASPWSTSLSPAERAEYNSIRQGQIPGWNPTANFLSPYRAPTATAAYSTPTSTTSVNYTTPTRNNYSTRGQHPAGNGYQGNNPTAHDGYQASASNTLDPRLQQARTTESPSHFITTLTESERTELLNCHVTQQLNHNAAQHFTREQENRNRDENGQTVVGQHTASQEQGNRNQNGQLYHPQAPAGSSSPYNRPAQYYAPAQRSPPRQTAHSHLPQQSSRPATPSGNGHYTGPPGNCSQQPDTPRGNGHNTSSEASPNSYAAHPEYHLKTPPYSASSPLPSQTQPGYQVQPTAPLQALVDYNRGATRTPGSAVSKPPRRSPSIVSDRGTHQSAQSTTSTPSPPSSATNGTSTATSSTHPNPRQQARGGSLNRLNHPNGLSLPLFQLPQANGTSVQTAAEHNTNQAIKGRPLKGSSRPPTPSQQPRDQYQNNGGLPLPPTAPHQQQPAQNQNNGSVSGPRSTTPDYATPKAVALQTVSKGLGAPVTFQKRKAQDQDNDHLTFPSAKRYQVENQNSDILSRPLNPSQQQQVIEENNLRLGLVSAAGLFPRVDALAASTVAGSEANSPSVTGSATTSHVFTSASKSGNITASSKGFGPQANLPPSQGSASAPKAGRATFPYPSAPAPPKYPPFPKPVVATALPPPAEPAKTVKYFVLTGPEEDETPIVYEHSFPPLSIASGPPPGYRQAVVREPPEVIQNQKQYKATLAQRAAEAKAAHEKFTAEGVDKKNRGAVRSPRPSYEPLTKANKTLKPRDREEFKRKDMAEPRMRPRAKGQQFSTPELRTLLTAFGDNAVPLEETCRVLDEILVDFIIETCHAASVHASYSRRQKIKLDDFKWALREDPRKLGRVVELQQREQHQRAMRKTIDIASDLKNAAKLVEDDGDGKKGKKRKAKREDEDGDGEEALGMKRAKSS